MEKTANSSMAAYSRAKSASPSSTPAVATAPCPYLSPTLHDHLLPKRPFLDLEVGCTEADRFTGRGGPAAIERLRERWAEVQNVALERLRLDVRVDHRSLEAQGIKREPGRLRGPAVSGIEARGEVAEVSRRREAERVERVQQRDDLVAEMRVVTREEMAVERVAVRERRELGREVTGEDRALVLPLVEADRREQLGPAQAAAERRAERRQGMGIDELKKKLVAQARAPRERIGREIGRVKA